MNFELIKWILETYERYISGPFRKIKDTFSSYRYHDLRGKHICIKHYYLGGETYDIPKLIYIRSIKEQEHLYEVAYFDEDGKKRNIKTYIIDIHEI